MTKKWIALLAAAGTALLFSAAALASGGGSLQQAEAFWQLGFRLGVGGVISFERANKTREVFRAMPLEALVLETDSPDMPLQGAQGTRNTPEALPKIAEILMTLREESSADVAKVLFETARHIFHHDQ